LGFRFRDLFFMRLSSSHDLGYWFGGSNRVD
jgi:hypothetical protein